jgi:hypothetical protein
MVIKEQPAKRKLQLHAQQPVMHNYRESMWHQRLGRGVATVLAAEARMHTLAGRQHISHYECSRTEIY